MEIMSNYLHFIFILFHGYRLDTLPMCLQRALCSKDNSVHTTATLTLSSDSSSSTPLGDTAFLRALRRVLRILQWVLLQVPPRSPRRPSTDQSCCAVRRWVQPSRWAPPHFSGGTASGSRCRSSCASLWGLEKCALSHAGCRDDPDSGCRRVSPPSSSRACRP